MALLSTAEQVVQKGFERGIDRESPRTMIKDGGYEDGQNVLLSNPLVGGKHIYSMNPDDVLDPLITWPANNPAFVSPFTFSTYDSVGQVLTFNTHLLIARYGGQYHRYDAPVSVGVAGTVTNVRRLVNTAGTGVNQWLINPFIYDRWLCVVDGRNPPMKYGQHFQSLWGETTPYLFPLGSLPLTACGPQLTGETWAHFAGGGGIFGALVNDASVPGGGSRVGTQSVFAPKNSAGPTSRVTFTASKDFTKAPTPYGGTTFASSDFLVFSFLPTDNTNTNFVIRLETDTSNYFQYGLTVTSPTANQWAVRTPVTIGSSTTVGAPSLTNINSISFFNANVTQDLYIDDLYFLYANAPPAAQVGVSHKNRIVAGGAPVSGTPALPFLSTLVWSNAGNPDNFPAANFQNISGGFESLARVNQITALREYIDTVIIGMPQAVFSWTIGDTGAPVKSTISTEHGIDSQRGIVETPSGSLIFPWQHGIYILRSTGRQYISAKVEPILVGSLGGVFENAPQWWMSVVDERTKTIRISYRAGITDPTFNNAGLVFDYVRAQDTGEPIFPCTMTQTFEHAVPAYINGLRNTLYTKFGSPHIWTMSATRGDNTPLSSFASPNIVSQVTFPWESLASKVFLDHWVAATFPYTSTVPVQCFVRYAANPGDFDAAVFSLVDTLPATQDNTTEARIPLGGAERWCQIKLVATGAGFEVFPPCTIFAQSTKRFP